MDGGSGGAQSQESLQCGALIERPTPVRSSFRTPTEDSPMGRLLEILSMGSNDSRQIAASVVIDCLEVLITQLSHRRQS